MLIVYQQTIKKDLIKNEHKERIKSYIYYIYKKNAFYFKIYIISIIFCIKAINNIY